MGKRSLGNFFAFRWMITPDIIKILYILGMILLNLSLLGSFIAGVVSFIMVDTGLDTLYIVLIIAGAAVVGIIIAIVFNLMLRMMCEQIILFFSIHETLVSLEEVNKDIFKESRKQSRSAPAIPAPPPE